MGGVGAKKTGEFGSQEARVCPLEKKMVMMFWVFLLHDRKTRARSKWWIVGTIITNMADF